MKKLDKYRCIVTMDDGKLKKCDLQGDGGPDMWAGSLNWKEVRDPVTQDFLDAVNEALDMRLTLNDFLPKNTRRNPR